MPLLWVLEGPGLTRERADCHWGDKLSQSEGTPHITTCSDAWQLMLLLQHSTLHASLAIRFQASQQRIPAFLLAGCSDTAQAFQFQSTENFSFSRKITHQIIRVIGMKTDVCLIKKKELTAFLELQQFYSSLHTRKLENLFVLITVTISCLMIVTSAESSPLKYFKMKR